MSSAAGVAPLACVFTIGHGDRESAELLACLGAVRVAMLVDVRSRPRSRRHPQFDQEPLRSACSAHGVLYHWAGRDLGGLRGARPDSPHVALPDGLRGFADHAESARFARAFAQLTTLARRAPLALLCAERDPLHCHRSLIADRLLLAGYRVVHLAGRGAAHEHRLRDTARPVPGGIVYDRGRQDDLPLH